MHVMVWWFGLDLLKPTMVICGSALWWMFVFTACYCFPVFMCEAEVYVHEIPDLTIFESRSVILELPSSRFWEDWSVWFVLDDVIVWHVWLDHFGVFDQYCDLLLGCFMVARWRTIGYCELSLMPSDADMDLLWSWWLSFDVISCSWRTDVIIVDYIYGAFSCLYRAEVIWWFVISWA